MDQVGMPRVFFNVQFGAVYADEHGTEVLDQIGACNTALEIVSQLARDATDNLWRGGSFRVVAEDEQRIRLFTIEVVLDRALAGAAQSSGAANEPHTGRSLL
jgi:hypothetical protein